MLQVLVVMCDTECLILKVFSELIVRNKNMRTFVVMGIGSYFHEGIFQWGKALGK